VLSTPATPAGPFRARAWRGDLLHPAAPVRRGRVRWRCAVGPGLLALAAGGKETSAARDVLIW
jgi:hypothetical protein